jgi:hypothetical protein
MILRKDTITIATTNMIGARKINTECVYYCVHIEVVTLNRELSGEKNQKATSITPGALANSLERARVGFWMPQLPWRIISLILDSRQK